ncbi:MAG: hypothetical protein LBB58_01295 [Cellulomonadaceae bacterium]|nr:hypothetical protein [Cellulomonadaceae bacterium]
MPLENSVPDFGAPASSAPTGNLPRKKRVIAVDLDTLAGLDEQLDVSVFGDHPSIDVAELSEQTGWSLEDIEKLRLWSGMPEKAADEKHFYPKDVEGLKDLKRFALAEQLDDESLGSMVRAMGSVMERLALWQVESIVQFLAARYGLNDTQARIEAAEYAPRLGKDFLPQFEMMWLHQYATAVRRMTLETVLQRGVNDDDQQFPLLRAVGYAQIVNFTELTTNLNTTQYGSLVQSFHNRAWDTIRAGGGRVIKQLGDGVLWVADDIGTGAEISLKLANMEVGQYGKPVHVGLTWGRVLAAYGNIFGPNVNLALQLARAASATEVYTSDEAATLLGRYAKYYSLEDVAKAVPGHESVHAFNLRLV